MKKFFTSILLCALAVTFNAYAAENEKLTIAVQPTSTPEQLTNQAQELKDFLKSELGMDVEIFFPTTYAGVVEALRFGHADIAFMGPWPALMAVEQAQASVILAEIREVIIGNEKKEEPYYFSYWVVSKDSPFNSLQELKGKKAAFSSLLSTSGYVAPLARLLELGLVSEKDGKVDPKEFFGEVLFAGGYAQAWEALKAGQVDATVIAGDVAEKLYNEVLENTRVIEQQGPLPSHTVVASANLDPALREKVVMTFLKLNDPDKRGLMRKFISGIFVRFEPATEEHLQSLRRMLELTNLEFKEKGK
ncbi:MAG: hypothetical protein A2Z88_02095 [Omnitrophica WOR_2 bacterium GWA2_47_8]|nr:MAG: hypothetical protein A2Z88_02095 [Omnitrophica WOR_2 bacterium GWA2_47_8]